MYNLENEWNSAKMYFYLFLQNLTMIHLPATNSCFLSEGTDDVPKPAELVKLLVSCSRSVVAVVVFVVVVNSQRSKTKSIESQRI